MAVSKDWPSAGTSGEKPEAHRLENDERQLAGGHCE
jgi:hypothetical protein